MYKGHLMPRVRVTEQDSLLLSIILASYYCSIHMYN